MPHNLDYLFVGPHFGALAQDQTFLLHCAMVRDGLVMDGLIPAAHSAISSLAVTVDSWCIVVHRVYIIETKLDDIHGSKLTLEPDLAAGSVSVERATETIRKFRHLQPMVKRSCNQ